TTSTRPLMALIVTKSGFGGVGALHRRRQAGARRSSRVTGWNAPGSAMPRPHFARESYALACQVTRVCVVRGSPRAPRGGRGLKGRGPKTAQERPVPAGFPPAFRARPRLEHPGPTRLRPETAFTAPRP